MPEPLHRHGEISDANVDLLYRGEPYEVTWDAVECDRDCTPGPNEILEYVHANGD